MEQPSSNAPLIVPAPGVAGWLPVWTKAVSQPSEQTFIELTERPDAVSKTAFIWVFLAATLSTIVVGILSVILQAMGFSSMPAIPGLEQYTSPGGAQGTSIISSLIASLCAAPVAGIFAVIFFAIGVGLVQWIAKLFGGAGTFDKLAYAVGAISVPLTLVTTILSPFSVIPVLGVCTGLLSLGAGIYGLVLQVMAVKGVNRFGWGAAIGSVLLPWLVIVLLCVCVVGVTLMLLGPAISEVFQQINQGIAP